MKVKCDACLEETDEFELNLQTKEKLCPECYEHICNERQQDEHEWEQSIEGEWEE